MTALDNLLESLFEAGSQCGKIELLSYLNLSSLRNITRLELAVKRRGIRCSFLKTSKKGRKKEGVRGGRDAAGFGVWLFDCVP